MGTQRRSSVRGGQAHSGVVAALIAALVCTFVFAGCGIREAAERGAERGAQKEIGRRLDTAVGDVYGGGKLGAEADAYKGHVSMEVRAERVGESPQVKLTGIVRNSGSRTVTYLKVRFSLLDEDGVQVAARTDLIAHGLSLGDNNSPVDPHSAKRFTSAVDNVPADWLPGSVRCIIEEIAIK